MGDFHILVILGSTRQQRRGSVVSDWILKRGSTLPGVRLELIDLRDWPLPFFDEATPSMPPGGKFSSEIANRWSAKILEAEGYILVTPEYNHAPPAILKNALDYAYEEWRKKPVAFVSYSDGRGMGIRAMEILKLICLTLQLVPVPKTVSIAEVQNAFNEDGSIKDSHQEESLGKLFKDLMWWATLLRDARAKLTQ